MDWIAHFRNRPNLDLTLFEGETITVEEQDRVGFSIAEFQRGESSEAKDYLAKAGRFSAESGDEEFLTASQLFVKEENYHSALLGAFMAQMGIEKPAGSWADDVFRRVRSWGDIGWSSRVLLAAELLAQVYYPALRKATNSPMLRRICDRIIEDEAYHIQFQTQRIAQVMEYHSLFSWMFQKLAGFVLFWGTAVVLWLEHRPVLGHSLSFFDYLKESFGRYQYAVTLLGKRQRNVEIEAATN